MRKESLTICFFLVASFSQGQVRGSSALHQGRSVLGSLCYLFQGYPDRVEGILFAYSNRKSAACEKYLVQLLEAPQAHQKELRESAVFLASRLYLDDNLKPFLVLNKKDSTREVGALYYLDMQKFTRMDRLLRDDLLSLCLLAQSPSVAMSTWLKSDSSVEPVRANVKSLLKRVTITQMILDGWEPPMIMR